jgi:excisionase family DNA binding protein
MPTLYQSDELLTVKEVAEMLRISKHAVYKYVNHADPEQRLPSVQFGASIRIKMSEVKAYIERAGQRVAVTRPGPKPKPGRPPGGKSSVPKIKYDPSKPFRVQDHF